MDEHTGDLGVLARKYQEQVQILETQLTEARRRLTVVTEAVELLQKEGIFQQESLFAAPISIGEKYKNLSMTQATEAILESIPLRKAPARIIILELQKNGFKSESKNLKRDVYTRLFRMVQKGKLVSKTEKGIKIYSLPQKEVSSLEEKSL